MKTGNNAVDVYYGDTRLVLVFLKSHQRIVLTAYEHCKWCKFNVLTAVNMKCMVLLDEVLYIFLTGTNVWEKPAPSFFTVKVAYSKDADSRFLSLAGS